MGTFWRKYLPREFASFVDFFRIISGNWAVKFGRPVKTAFSVSIETFFEKKLCLRTNEIFYHFQTLSRKFSASFRVFRRGCWSCILRVQNNILTKNSFISIFFHFSTLSDFFDQFLQKKVAELSKLNSQFQWKLSGEFFCKSYKLLFFWISSGKFSASCPKKVSEAFKLLSTSPWEFFEEKTFEKFLQLLWTFFRIISGNWAGKIWPVSQNCILRIYREIFWKKNCVGEKIKFFIIFRHWAGSFRLLSEFFHRDVGAAFYVSKITF